IGLNVEDAGDATDPLSKLLDVTTVSRGCEIHWTPAGLSGPNHREHLSAQRYSLYSWINSIGKTCRETAFPSDNPVSEPVSAKWISGNEPQCGFVIKVRSH